MSKKPKYLTIALAYIIFLLCTLNIKGAGYTSWISLAVTFVVFTFAIFLAFSISNRRDRLVSLRENLRQIDALVLSLNKYAKYFGDDFCQGLLPLLDEYLILQVDYSLRDFRKSQPLLLKIYDYILESEAKTAEQKDIKMKMMENLEGQLILRKKVEFNIADNMQTYEWLTIVGLSLLTLFCLFFINDKSVASSIVLPILETVIVVILITIYDLDSLRWQEQNWIWKPLGDLFTGIELAPYFPDVIFVDRVNAKLLDEFESFRIGYYIHKNSYPDFEKEIKTYHRGDAKAVEQSIS
jgi:hypothetical protein